tara:strand:+ start:727 stop:1944 length:1218 start_codon:yes stop_codon:yes gene_type:complete
MKNGNLSKKDIFSPQNKVIANVDRVIEFIETGNTSPVLVEVDPSNACNHGCYFCISSYIHLPESKNLETFDRSVMSRQMLLDVCKDLINMDVRAINWTGGGEPTINPHLGEAIEYIGKNSNIKMGMFTNGTLLDRFDLFEILVDNMTWIRISVDSGTEKTFNHIRRPGKGQDWNKMLLNLQKLIDINNSKGKKIDIGTGFVITPDTYTEIVDFANTFKNYDLTYCQYKPEVVNREREGGIQRKVNFWNERVQPLLDEAKLILGTKFQINGYHLVDLAEDPSLLGRHYKKCLGSQIQPCIGADGHVYVCPNHRGYKQYSYGSLREKSFKEIWKDIENRRDIMNKIDNIECFSNCTQLCKPHESNKMFWNIYKSYNELSNSNKKAYKESLFEKQKQVRKKISHTEFI